MENADALDLSKENIQPLKRGRNTGQLSFALQAQSDVALQQMLNKKLEWYEMQIRTYEGTDPLELWCEYVSWVEQSFPKHGPEANLTIILQKCFHALKGDEKYKNDIRFVKLWIKYIEMQNDTNRLELYLLMQTQGIGLKCAEFYRSWASEYVSVGEWRQAEAIIAKGFSNMAQPAEELEAARQNFSASLVYHLKNTNNEAPDELENNLLTDHRMPMAALKPIGKKSAAPNVRVGSNVKNQLPGVVTAGQGSSVRPSAPPKSFGVRGNNAGPVTIYQGEPEPEPTFGQIVPTAVHLPQSLNKENIVKAGPWTGQGLGSRKHQTTAIGHALVPRQPGFEVHKDEDADAASSHDIRPLGVTVPHVLQPRKALEDGFHDAIAIYEEPNPFYKSMYRKTEVYGGAKELQLEELHAIDYFRKRSERERSHIKESSFQSNHAEENGSYSRKLISSISSPSSNGIVISQDEDREMVEIQELSSRQPCPTENSAPIVGIESTIGSYHQHLHEPLSMYGSTLEPGAGAHCSPEIHHQQPHQGNRFQPSNQSLNNQSMTVHTKLANLEVDNYWSSPTISKTAPCGPSIPTSSGTDMYHPQSEFHGMRDDSLSDQVINNSPLRNTDPQPFAQNQYCKPRDEGFGSVATSEARGHPEPEREMEPYSIHPSDNYRHFENPMTQSYMKHHNGFHVYQEEPYPAVSQPAKFAVFCDETENAAPTRSLSGERTDLSSSTHTSSSSIQKIAREKENIHKFPQADIELLEDCGAASIPERQEQLDWQQQPSDCNYNMGTASYAPSVQGQPLAYMDHNLHGPVHPHPATSHEAMTSVGHLPHSSHSVAYDGMQGGPTYSSMQHTHSMAYGVAHHDLMYPSYIPNQGIHEPMEDDATVAAAPTVGVNMSETGVTETFFFQNMDAASTPYQMSPKKSRASKTPVDFNSSLYRCELSWPDEEEGVDCNRPDAPKIVPPLKLFRIKNDGDQLSAIMESSKERYQSVLSSGSSRNSTSAFVNNRQGMQTTMRQSFQPQFCLNQIEESSEPLSSSSSSQEGQAQVQLPAQGPNLKQMHEMSMRLERGEINPFDNRLLEYFLFKMSFPLPHHADGYHSLSNAVPAKRNNSLNLGGTLFSVSKVLGEGAYAKVLKAVNTSTQKEVALKIQKPGCRWEYYICREIQHRLSQQDLASAFMPADQIFVYNNGSIIVTDLLTFGTLLNLVNKVVATTKRPMLESQALFLLDQLISAVKALHDCKIIHGDLKPDNVLLRSIPTNSQVPCIQLIDFGRSIDMALMPSGTTFNQVVMTDTFTCIEMRTNRPWTYQTDLFGLANTAHCLLLGDYMKVQEIKSTGRWALQSKLPRHVNSEFWGTFFDTLLNIESCDALPDLETLRADVQSSMSNSGQLQLAVSALGRLMLSR